MGRPDSLAPITQQPLPQDSLVAGSQLNSYRTQQDEIHSTQNDSYYGSRPRTPTYPEQVENINCVSERLLKIFWFRTVM